MKPLLYKAFLFLLIAGFAVEATGQDDSLTIDSLKKTLQPQEEDFETVSTSKKRISE